MAGCPVTIIVPTSPIKSHPSTEIIERTVESIRRHLPDAPLIITADGVPEKLEKYRTQYEEYCAKLDDLWPETTVVKYPDHVHQCEMMGMGLSLTMTPLVFYLENDWEILDYIEWDLLSDIILSRELNYIKLHAADRVHPLHEHLMLGHEIIRGVPLIHTRQFSANPHLASAEWYRELDRKWLRGRYDFCENVLHGILAQLPQEETRMAIYNPIHGGMRRVSHLDGRGGEEQ